MTAALQSGLTERLALSLDAFAPVQARQLQRPDRNIAVDEIVFDVDEAVKAKAAR